MNCDFCGGYRLVFAAYVKDKKELLKSSSGGIATQLAVEFIKKGWWVAGVRYTKDYSSVEYYISNSIDDIAEYRGSKYVLPKANGVFEKIKELLNNNEKILFFGVPCRIKSLINYLKYHDISTENIYLCDLICHGITYPFVHKQFIEYLEKKENSNIEEFSVRYKHKHWDPSYVYARFSNGKKYIRPFYETEYGYAFWKMSMRSCYSCGFKGNNTYGDLMVGDFWGANPEDSFYNIDGVSAVIIESSKGMEMIRSISEKVYLEKTTYDRVIKCNKSIIMCKDNINERNNLYGLIKKNGLIKAVRFCVPKREKIKMILRRHLDNKFIYIVYRIYQAVKKKGIFRENNSL